MPAAPAQPARHGVIDIGSNSIRLVVFDGSGRVPLPLFNEKILCGIGRGVQRTGRLHAEGAALALDNLERFAALLDSMDVGQVDAVATAAVRDAADGADFVREGARRTGLSIRVLSGEREAALAAAGVLSGMPDADGLMGDLGGGSLELVRLADGAAAEHATLPLGPLNLGGATKREFTRARKAVDAALAEVPWLRNCAGSDLYAVGGNWRALARIHMARTEYPLRVIHYYRVRRRALMELAGFVTRQSRESLAELRGAPRRRLDLLPMAALVIQRLLRAATPRDVVFSAQGLREGLAHEHLPAACRAQDPLLAACQDLAARNARFPQWGDELAVWTQALFPGEAAGDARLRRAACLLSDIGWRAHPDYRAEQASAGVLYAPALHARHEERCFLARAVFARYNGREGGEAEAVPQLLRAAAARRAHIIGLAARLGDTVSSGVPGLVGRFPLVLSRRKLVLRHQPEDRAMIGEAVMRRLEMLAAAMGRRPDVRVCDAATEQPA